MATATKTENRIEISTEYRDKDRIRQVPGARWDADRRVWHAPLAWTTCKMLRAIFGDDLAITPDLADWAWTEHDERIAPALAMRATAMDPDSDVEGDERLYGFQRSGVAFLKNARQAILADEMGTGKTVQTITALEEIGDDAYPALVVCPSSVKRNWKNEFATWAPERKVVVVAGTAAKRRTLLASDADVFVMNFDLLRFHSRLAAYGSIAMTDKEKEPKELNSIEFRSVIADEAHRIKDAKAKQSRALKAAAGDALYRFALTGTPIANRPDEIWSLLNFVAPAEWPSKTRFVDRYCATNWNGFGTEITGISAQAKDEFFSVIDPRFLRRSKALVLPQLPSKVRETRMVALAPAQQKAYDQMEESYIAAVEGGNVMATTPLSQATRLSQFAAATVEIVGNDEVRLSAPSAKIDALLEVLDDLGDEPVCVFAQSRQLIDLAAAALDERGISYGRITGTESEAQRDVAVQKFQANGLRVMLMTLGAGGVGLTLTASSTVVFLQRSWSMVNNRQAEDRVHRIGQDADSVLIIDLISEGTIEEYQISKLAEKDALLEEIVRDHAALAEFLKKKKES